MNHATTHEPLTVVIVDDDPAQLRLLEVCVRKATADRRAAVSIETYTEADRALVELPADGEVVILCDYMLEKSTGLEWLADFISTGVGPVILVTASGDQQVASEAFRNGAADYIVKTKAYQSPERLERAINEALRRFSLDKTNRDLSRRLKLANRELERKNLALAEMTATAHRFVDDVAHEFRTPLAVVKEFASILTDGLGGPVTEKQASYLAFISDATCDLSHLIDDFLDSGKLRARTLRVDRKSHAINDLLDAAWPMLESRGSLKNITLKRSVANDLPNVFVDADKFRRTLINLVINAIKFSNADSTVTVRACTNSVSAVRVEVIDHGPGLGEQETQQMFERFRQFDSSTQTSSKGFGLGLNIVRELVTLNLGEVSVQSTLVEGSTFSFTMPVAEIAPVIDAFLGRASSRSPHASMSVLCIRDSGDNASLNTVRSFIASTCHATDIYLMAPDGQSVIVIGETLEPQRWQARLEEEDAKNQMHTPELGRRHLVIEPIGTWPVQDVREPILHVLCPSVKDQCIA